MCRVMYDVAVAAAFLLCSLAAQSVGGQDAKSPDAEDYYDLGGFHHKITTDSKAAQTWFDRGLAMCYGQSTLALKSARDLVQQVPEEMLKAQTDYIDAFIPTALHVLVRFGRWQEILDKPEPADYLPVTCSIWHYARALAYAATGQLDRARAEQKAFATVRRAVPETSVLFQNASQNILGVAQSMLAGEIAYREGKFEIAFRHLREAVRRDDALNYDEPWGWMQPARHAFGALLLEQRRFEESESVYRADLKRHPNNPWSLHGLAECLEARGKAQEAAMVRKQFEEASSRSDVKIDRSCYCRLNAKR